MRTHRHGHSLIECLIALTMMAGVLAAIAVTMHALYQTDHRVRERLARDRELERLATSFRSDVHQAQAATLGGEGAAKGSQLVLACLGQRTVQYTLQPPRAERIVRRADSVTQRETFRLPAAAAARWQVDKDRPLVSFVVEQLGDVPGIATPRRAYRIDATLRLVQPAATPPESARKPDAPKS